MPGQPHHDLIYKICPRSAWQSAVEQGSYAGSADDLRDGFIHLSTAAQVRATAAKYFTGVTGLVLVAVDPAALGEHLKWEPARGGQLFPHLYGNLPVAASVWVADLGLGAAGAHVFPEGLA